MAKLQTVIPPKPFLRGPSHRHITSNDRLAPNAERWRETRQRMFRTDRHSPYSAPEAESGMSRGRLSQRWPIRDRDRAASLYSAPFVHQYVGGASAALPFMRSEAERG